MQSHGLPLRHLPIFIHPPRLGQERIHPSREATGRISPSRPNPPLPPPSLLLFAGFRLHPSRKSLATTWRMRSNAGGKQTNEQTLCTASISGFYIGGDLIDLATACFSQFGSIGLDAYFHDFFISVSEIRRFVCVFFLSTRSQVQCLNGRDFSRPFFKQLWVAIVVQPTIKVFIGLSRLVEEKFSAMEAGDRSQMPVSLPPPSIPPIPPMSMLSTASLQPPETERKPTVIRNGEEKREEWSARAVALFLDLYEEKYFEMDRGSFRSKDWEQLVERFNMEGGGGKSVKQCRDKMDSLKKRHKLERGRKASTGAETCSWMWFDKMDSMFGDNPKHQANVVLLGPPEAVDMKFPAEKFRVAGGENVVIEEEESRRLVGSWREAKKVLQELPLSAEERGKARTLLLEKKEEERLEYFEGDSEEVSHCLKLLVERASVQSSGTAGVIRMDLEVASDIQRRLEEVLTDVISMKRRATSDLRYFMPAAKSSKG